MRLLHKIRALQRRCELSQQRCDLRLAQIAREDDELRREEEELAARTDGTKQLLEAQRPVDVVLDRDGLFEVLRKQAVVRSQLNHLGMQTGQINEQRQALAERRNEQREERRIWLHKQDKYQRWASLMRKQERLFRLRIDEAESEERTKWKR